VRAPVPVGKGLMSASRPKCLIAKCRGVEKCSFVLCVSLTLVESLEEILTGNVSYAESF
jgi:hypothetical protein